MEDLVKLLTGEQEPKVKKRIMKGNINFEEVKKILQNLKSESKIDYIKIHESYMQKIVKYVFKEIESSKVLSLVEKYFGISLAERMHTSTIVEGEYKIFSRGNKSTNILYLRKGIPGIHLGKGDSVPYPHCKIKYSINKS